MKVRISYANYFSKPEAHRFNKICNAFYEVADLGAETDDKCDKMTERIQELKWEFTQVGDDFEDTENVHVTTSTTGFGVTRTQEGFTLNETEMQRSQYIGGESFAFNGGSLMWPNMCAHPNFIGIHPYYGHPNILLGERYPFQSSTGGQGLGMNSVFFNGSESQISRYKCEWKNGGCCAPPHSNHPNSDLHSSWRACYDLAPTSMPSPEEEKVEEEPKI
ncbi:hypothetical protein ACSBR2_041334 [Camellia fascicularis]